MTPNDMPPLPEAAVDAYRPTRGEHGFSHHVAHPDPLANHQGWAPRRPPCRAAEPVDLIHGIGIKNAITN